MKTNLRLHYYYYSNLSSQKDEIFNHTTLMSSRRFALLFFWSRYIAVPATACTIILAISTYDKFPKLPPLARQVFDFILIGLCCFTVLFPLTWLVLGVFLNADWSLKVLCHVYRDNMCRCLLLFWELALAYLLWSQFWRKKNRKLKMCGRRILERWSSENSDHFL